jgi:hypothetical protein
MIHEVVYGRVNIDSVVVKIVAVEKTCRNSNMKAQSLGAHWSAEYCM